jgi:linoleoyl-CoA desaturase
MAEAAPELAGFAAGVDALGRRAFGEVGEADLVRLRRLKRVSQVAEVAGRLALHLPTGPLGFCAGVASLVVHLGLEAQLNHSIQHGAYLGLARGTGLDRTGYETLALPLQTRTWRDAHRIHHANPSLLELDPDTVHPLFRVHPDTPWRWWHRWNGLLGTVFVFECWGRDYDRLLKARGLRAADDRSELWKLLAFVGYQYVLFPLLAGPLALRVLIGTLIAVVLRNLIFVALQTASSVGERVSMLHPHASGPMTRDQRYRFQVETSKNYLAGPLFTLLSGGLDRHIEHHLFPRLPPTQLRRLSPEVRQLCQRHGVRYEEHPTPWRSLADSIGHLRAMARRPTNPLDRADLVR